MFRVWIKLVLIKSLDLKNTFMSGYLYDDKVNIRDFIADEIVKS